MYHANTYSMRASTGFATVAAGKLGRFVHISAIFLSFYVVKVKVRAPYRPVIFIYHIVVSSTVTSNMQELPNPEE